MYWYLCGQFAIDTVNSYSQKSVQFLSVNVCDSSPKYSYVFAARNKATSNQIDADKIKRAQLNVASWYLGRRMVASLRYSVVRLGGRMNEGWVSKINEQVGSGNR
jgi:hypothetical protein